MQSYRLLHPPCFPLILLYNAKCIQNDYRRDFLMNHPLLHQPISLGSLTLKNRLVLPPMATENRTRAR